jgi:hypothetical protein
MSKRKRARIAKAQSSRCLSLMRAFLVVNCQRLVECFEWAASVGKNK